METLVGKGVFKLSCQKEELILYSNDGSQSSEEWVNAISLAIAQHRSNSASLRYKKIYIPILIYIFKIIFSLNQSCWQAQILFVVCKKLLTLFPGPAIFIEIKIQLSGTTAGFPSGILIKIHEEFHRHRSAGLATGILK